MGSHVYRREQTVAPLTSLGWIVVFVLFAATVSTTVSAQAQPPQPSDSQLEIRHIRLHHRGAEEILPLIRPLLSAGGVASGSGFDIVLRADTATLAQIEASIPQLDRAPAELIIRVMQDVPLSRARNLLQARSDRYYATAGANGRTLMLRLEEGRPARFVSGEWRRVWDAAYRGFFGVGASSHPRFEGVGLVVEARMIKDRVKLHISPMQSESGSDRNDVYEVRELTTTVSVQLDRWERLGQERSDVVDERVVSTARTGADGGAILIKVELAADR